MGFQKNWYDFIWVIFCSSLMLFSSSVLAADSESFGGFLLNYANNSLPKPRTGVLYNISLPANFSGIQVSFIRLRSGGFWVRGVNLSDVFIPPGVIPTPYVRRIAIVYENLGNWSSYYYQVPGYKFVAPVIGFTVYDSSNFTKMGRQKLHLKVLGDPISVMFPQIELGGEDEEALCVKFGAGGSFELKNMTQGNFCSATDEGHFSIVIPISPKKKDLLWEWWVVGFGGGLVGLALVALVFGAILRSLRKKNIGEMERESESGVTFDTVWIGKSKMPCASMVRTQPCLENRYVP